MKTGRIPKRIMCTVIVALILLYVMYQLYMVSGSSVKYQTAVLQKSYDILETEAFAVRNEHLLYSNEAGTKINEVSDGTRVSNSTVVKRVFRNEDDARLYQELTEINERIAYYESIQLQQRVMNIDRNTNDNNLNNAYFDILYGINGNDYETALSKAEDMRHYITNKQILTGKKIDVSDAITSLKDRRERIMNTLTSTDVLSDSVGYFCASPDGFENTLSYENILSLTTEDINGALNAAPSAIPDNAVGKINEDFVWYFACVVDTAAIGTLKSGDVLTVRIPRVSESIKMSVYSMKSADTEHSILILSSRDMNASLANIRIETIQIVLNEVYGIRTRKDSLRVDKDGTLGVYVLSGNYIRFKPVECGYVADDYVIVQLPGSENNSKLEVYDSVIYEGKNLYEGKLL